MTNTYVIINERSLVQVIDEFIEKGLELTDWNLLEEQTPQCPTEKNLIPTVESAYDQEIRNFFEWG